MVSKADLSQYRWMNGPSRFTLLPESLKFFTDPGTDLWQRTYYGFRHDNAHAFTIEVSEKEFSFSVATLWKPEALFDQCGILLYQDMDNWFKASVEYENQEFSRLGSVVTNLGYSDWATTDIRSSQMSMTYRLSRRGQDFLAENSEDGHSFKQMRIFHLHQVRSMVRVGIYACSPLQSSMEVSFDHFELGECAWELFENSKD